MSVPLDASDIPDYERRLNAMRDRARWSIGDRYWADVLIRAFMDPAADSARLAEEMDR